MLNIDNLKSLSKRDKELLVETFMALANESQANMNVLTKSITSNEVKWESTRDDFYLLLGRKQMAMEIASQLYDLLYLQ